jgi:hypothetical protein
MRRILLITLLVIAAIGWLLFRSVHALDDGAPAGDKPPPYSGIAQAHTSDDYLSPELRAEVEELKRAVREEPTTPATVKNRCRILWEWTNAWSLTGGVVPEDLLFEAAIPLIGAEDRISMSSYISLDRYVRELDVREERPDAIGLLTSDASGSFHVGSFQTVVQTYTVGTMPMVPGGGVMVPKHLMSDQPRYQADDPTADNYVSVRTSNSAASFVPTSLIRRGVHGGNVRGTEALAFRLEGATLVKGDTITITFGDRSGGSRGFTVQSMANDRYPLPVYVDLEGEGNFFTLPVNTYRVVGGPVHSVHGFAPSIVGVGEPFELSIRSEDLGYNRATGPIPWYEVALNTEPFTTIDAGEDSITVLEDLTIDSPGVYRFGIRSADGTVTGTSNPIWVRENPTTRIFWGDSHGHSGFAEGQGTPEGYYTYGRDDARLDFLTLSEHDIWLDDLEWAHLQEIVGRFTEEGRFIAHNVFFRTSGGRVRQGLHTATSLSRLYQDLRAANDLDDVLIIPHCHEAGEWRMNDPDLERLVEIMSMHGTFEWFGRAYLAQGFQVGFVAASDDHIGKPGYSGPRRANHQRNGLAAVLAAEKTTNAIFDALRDRATYATTGARIILDATLDGARMGTRIEHTEDRRIAGRVIGTAPIDTVTVVKNGEEVWSRDYLTVQRGDSPYLELSFFSESRPLIRDNPRGYHMWSGVLEVSGARVVDVAGPSLENRVYHDASLDPDHPYRVEFATATRGQKRSIILEFDSVDDSTRIDVRLEASRELSGNSLFRRGVRIPGSQTTFSLGEMRNGTISKEFRVGRYRDLMTLRFVDPHGAMEREFEFADTTQPLRGDSYYLRVEQLDHEIAWSSPWWVGGFPTR